MFSFQEFNESLNEGADGQRIAVNAIVAALEKDDIPFSNLRDSDKTSLMITVKKDTKIKITKDGDISYTYKGKAENLVFKKPKEIADKIVDLINQNGIGDSAFGVF